MITIIIDGYNFIFNSYFKIRVRSEKLQKLREDAILFLSKYYNIKRNKVIVVFDGYKTEEAFESRYNIGNIDVVYSKKNEKADEVIIRMAKNFSNSIVVTDDNEIRRGVEGQNCSCMGVEEFKSLIAGIINEKSGFETDNYLISEEEEYDNEYNNKKDKKKGNPRKLSRKERLKMKKIKKI